MKVRDVIKRIEADGWVYARTRGDHHHFVHPTKPGLTTVAGHLSGEVPTGTLLKIWKQAGLSKREDSDENKH